MPQEAKTFLEHLEDLRKALIRSAAALAIGMAVAVPLAPRIFAILQRPLRQVTTVSPLFLQPMSVTGGMTVAMQTILWSGVVFAAPFIAFFVGAFLFPGLTKKEKRVILGSVFFAVLLFAAGAAMGFFVTMPAALQIMLWFNDWMGIKAEFFPVADYVRFTLLVIASFGLTFELPLILLILGQLGLVTSRQLRDKRRHAILGIVILAAVVTPTTDPFNQMVMAVPLVVLYELCIWIIWLKERRRAQAGTGAHPPDMQA